MIEVKQYLSAGFHREETAFVRANHEQTARVQHFDTHVQFTQTGARSIMLIELC